MKTTYAIFDSEGRFIRFEEIDPSGLPPIPLASDGAPRAVPVTHEPPLVEGKAHAYSRSGRDDLDLPAAPVPTNLPAWRIRAVLKRRGLLANVKTLISSLPEEQRDIAEEQLVDSKFERSHPLIEQLGKALGLSSSDLDGIFREADALT